MSIPCNTHAQYIYSVGRLPPSKASMTHSICAWEHHGIYANNEDEIREMMSGRLVIVGKRLNPLRANPKPTQDIIEMCARKSRDLITSHKIMNLISKEE